MQPGWFAAVMATGIVSIGAVQAGRPLLSWALFGVGALCFLVLAALSGLRGAEVRRVEALTFVAGTAVLGSRLALAGDLRAALALAAVAAVAWAALVASAVRDAAGGGRGGSALLAVVAPESLAVLGGILGRRLHVEPLTLAGYAFWAAGLLAYLLLGPGVCRRVARAAAGRGEFGGDDWIAMGAIAIATVAAAELALPLPTLALWAAATALLPLVIAADLRSGPRRFESRRWATVFPLGMYAVASYEAGAVEALRALDDVGLAAFWIAVAAWAVTAAGAARRGY